MSLTAQRSRGVEPVRWVYPYDPTGNAKQIRFHSVVAREKLYGGAAASGKSEAMIAEVLGVVLRFGVAGLILRRTTTAMGDLTRRLLTRIPPAVGRWNEQKKTWTFTNGGTLMLGHLERDTDIQRYAGNEFAIIAWDELTQFSEWQYLRMFHPLRISTAHPGYPAMQEAGIQPYYIGATNPGGVGHGWVKSRFVDPAPPGVLWQPRASTKETAPGSRIFVPATVYDNPHMPESYIRQLEALPDNERAMLLHGSWDVYAGQMFAEFDRDLHVVSPDDYPISLGGQAKAMGVDFGISNPYCALWGAMCPDDTIVIYRELYDTDKLAPEQARDILMAERPGERGPSRQIPVHLDPACWQRSPTSPKSPTPGAPPPDSVAWHYRQAGLPVTKALNERIAGWQEVKRRLRPDRSGRPHLLIYNTCVDLIRTLPTLTRSNANPEDVDTTLEDHAADALRYLCMGWRGMQHHAASIDTNKGKDPWKDGGSMLSMPN